MNILILGDVMGAAGRKALNNKLPKLIEKKNITFVIVNGENAADDGRGITQEIAEKFFTIFTSAWLQCNTRSQMLQRRLVSNTTTNVLLSTKTFSL